MTGNSNVTLGMRLRPSYTYSGTSTFIDDGDAGWRLKMLTSGTLKFTDVGCPGNLIDVFLVGGGGGGGNDTYAGGGGGGYTKTQKSVTISVNTNYTVTIGAGGAKAATYADGGNGGTSSAFGYSAAGGYGGCRTGASGSGIIDSAGGNGGSGGGNGGGNTNSVNGKDSAGGSDGSDSPYIKQGTSDTNHQGKGQGTTTREFGEAGAALYAGGGGGGIDGSGGLGGGGKSIRFSQAQSGTANTGGGGGAAESDVGGTPGNGGSGIVIIRNHR